MNFLAAHYGPAEGPLGFPMPDRQARALDALLKAMPKDDAYRYRKAVVARPPTELSPGERADVSWISTEDPDRAGDVVLAKGMNDSQFRQNPIVTMQHAYHLPPVGRSLWRKVVKDGQLKGIKAKTQYPTRPPDWPAEKDWPPDIAFTLVQADLLRGKSIGFLPTRVHVPTEQEADQNNWKNVGLVIDEWLLLEYACTFLPAQQNAVVEAVSKSDLTIPEDFLKVMGLDLPALAPAEPGPVIPFTRLAELEKSLGRAVERFDPIALAERAVQDRLDRLRGRVE